MSLLTIITPVYNNVSFVSLAIENYLSQEISNENYHNRIIGSGAPWFDGLNVGLLVIQK